MKQSYRNILLHPPEEVILLPGALSERLKMERWVLYVNDDDPESEKEEDL